MFIFEPEIHQDMMRKQLLMKQETSCLFVSSLYLEWKGWHLLDKGYLFERGI